MERTKSLKALRKDFYMELVKTYNKFLSLLVIVALGVAFYSGLRATGPDMEISADTLFDKSDFMDVKIMSEAGINEEYIDKLNELECVNTAEGAYGIEVIDETLPDTAVISLMSISNNINVPSIVDGRNIEKKTECIVDTSYMQEQNYQLGDTIKVKSGTEVGIEYSLKEKEYTIVGTFTSPFYLKNDKGSCGIGSGKINGAVYIDEENFLLPVFTCGYITISDAKEIHCYDDRYDEHIENAVNEIKKLSESENIHFLDRDMISQYVEYEMDSERISKIGDIVPIIFFIVAALVCLTTMIRMVEEQRTQIGTLKALGYGNILISMKYIMYGFLATVSGSIIGGVLGCKFLPLVIINAYKIVYNNLTVIETPINIFHFSIAFVMALVSVIGATIVACYKSLNSSAANLMRPLAPKNGKRILLERIPFIWKHLSFIWKSTMRNILRYKKKMFMTIFGICGCTALLVIGFGIKDSIYYIVDTQYGQLHTYNEILTYENGLDEGAKKKANEAIIGMEQVKEVLGIYQGGATFESGEDNATGYIYVPENEKELEKYVLLRDEKDKGNITLKDGEIVVTSKMAKLFDLSVGDELSIELSNGKKGTALIGAITENYVFHYVYMNKNTCKEIFDIEGNPTQLFVNFKDEYVNEDLAKEFLKVDGIGSTNSIDTLRGTFSEMLAGLDIIIIVIVAAAGGLAFVVLYNLNTINIGERIRELATLKVLGFYDGEVSSYVFRENIILTVMGIVCGFFMGKVLHKTVIDTVEPNFVMFGREVYFTSYLYATLITLLFAIIINLSMHNKLKKIDMSTSMKSVE